MSSWPAWPSIPNHFSSSSSLSSSTKPLNVTQPTFEQLPSPALHNSNHGLAHDRSLTRPLLSYFTHARDTFLSQPPSVVAGTSCVFGGLTILAGRRVYKRRFVRLRNSDWVTPAVLNSRRRWVRGVVTRVGDADNFRLFHTPGPFWRWPLKLRHVPRTAKLLKDETLHIRIAGVDAPESSYFGKPGQLGADMVKSWLRKEVEGKTIWVELLRKDQYNRVVGFPYLPPRVLSAWRFKGRPLPLKMLREGMGTTYEQAGAAYGPYTKEDFLAEELVAKNAFLGIWNMGEPGESPAEYKLRMKTATPVELEKEKKRVVLLEAAEKERLDAEMKNAHKGWFRRLFRRS